MHKRKAAVTAEFGQFCELASRIYRGKLWALVITHRNQQLTLANQQ